MNDVGQKALSADVPSHPEEIKTVFDFRIGKQITLQGSARITPAGIVTAGITAALIIAAVGFLASSLRRGRY